MRDLRAAVWEFESRAGDVEANLAALGRAVAAARDADLFVAPEMFATAWLPARTDWAVAEDDALFRRVGAVAAEHGAWIASSVMTRRGGKPRNTFTLWDPAGDVVGRQDKVHLFREEAETLAPGEPGPPLELADCKLGGTVCYDVEFPEYARRLALAGAEVLAVSAAFFTAQDWDLMTRTRALENGMFVVAANQVGGTMARPHCGRSKIVSPSGAVLAETKGQGNEVASATLAAADLAKARAWSPYLERRRMGFEGRMLARP